MRMGGDLAAEPVCLGNQRRHLLRAVLLEYGIVALGKDTAGGAELDHVGTVLDYLANLVLHARNAVGGSFGGVLEFRREQVAVAMAAGDAQRRSGHLHPWTNNIAIVDGIAQG